MAVKDAAADMITAATATSTTIGNTRCALSLTGQKLASVASLAARQENVRLEFLQLNIRGWR
jgi:hypothetical protein